MKIYNNFFGEFGGRYVAEILRPSLDELENVYIKALSDKNFQDDFELFCKTFIGRPTPLYFAENISKKLGEAKIYIKLEGLANTGAHKITSR